MTTTPDFRAELKRLVDLYEALGGNWSPHGYTDTWNDALASARTALATPPPEPPVAAGVPHWSEGICGDGAAILRDGVMTPIEEVIAELNRRPPPEPPTDEEIADWHGQCADLTRLREADHYWAFDLQSDEVAGVVRAALARWGRPATPPPEPLRPIPVSERLPGPGDCAPWPGEPDATPWCWAGRRNDGGWEWRQGLSAKSLSWCIAGGGWSHWLPYNAIPFPEVTQ